jgi:hypothetical protein
VHRVTPLSFREQGWVIDISSFLFPRSLQRPGAATAVEEQTGLDDHSRRFMFDERLSENRLGVPD